MHSSSDIQWAMRMLLAGYKVRRASWRSDFYIELDQVWFELHKNDLEGTDWERVDE